MQWPAKRKQLISASVMGWFFFYTSIQGGRGLCLELQWVCFKKPIPHAVSNEGLLSELQPPTAPLHSINFLPFFFIDYLEGLHGCQLSELFASHFFIFLDPLIWTRSSVQCCSSCFRINNIHVLVPPWLSHMSPGFGIFLVGFGRKNYSWFCFG